MIMFKDVGVDRVPNYTRDIKQGIARWDAYLHVSDPDALAAEFLSRDVEFSVHRLTSPFRRRRLVPSRTAAAEAQA